MTFPLRKGPSGPKAGASAGPQTGWSLIPAQFLPVALVFTPVPGVVPIVFPEWSDGDVLDGEIFVSFGGDTPDQVNGGFLPQVSLDGGATWKVLLGGASIVAAGLQLGDPDDSQGASISMGFAAELPGGSSPMIRVAYASQYQVNVGGTPPNQFTSLLRCRRLAAGSYVGSPPNTVAP